MQLAIIGSGTAIPHPRRSASGYALIAPDGALQLECGAGSTRRWPELGLTFESLAGVLVTHYHLDHCGELAAVLFGRNVPEPEVATPFVLAGPIGHRAHVEALRSLYGSSLSDRGGGITVEELGDHGRAQIGAFTVTSRRVAHSEGAIGVRIERGGRSIAFSGDSAPCEALVELCRGVDVALLECSYPKSRPSTKHLTSVTAAEIAVAAGVRRLVLSHFYALCDDVDIAAEVRAAGYDGELVLAEDGMRIEV